MQAKIISLVTLIFLSFAGYCQNLIENGDFEGIFSKNLSNVDIINKCKWIATNGWSPIRCSTNYDNEPGVVPPIVAFGGKKPFKGDAFIAMDTYSFIHTPLKNELEAGKYYCFTMYVMMCKEGAAKGEIGVYFAKTIKMGSNEGFDKKGNPVIKMTPMSTFYKPNFDITLQTVDTTDWIKVCGLYKATGGEKFVAIGNFWSVYKNKDSTDILVDDISLVLVSGNNNGCCEEKIRAKTGDTLKLKHLQFKKSSAVIDSSSFPELNSLADFLKKNPLFKIQINGHTDNSGTTEENIQLSKERARAVYQYLLQKGIKTERMAYNGYGDSKPLVPNTSEINKEKNRRVEIRFL